MPQKSKTSLGRVAFKQGPPKKTKQGDGHHSLPNHGRKKSRGQGK
jgi:hypothetical protein